jgi:hypothetical protein
MSRRIAFLGLLFAALLATAPRAQEGGLPPEFRSAADAARASLCALYAVPPAACAAPIAVRVVTLPSDLPPGWRDLPTYAAGAADEPGGRIVVILSRCGGYPFGDADQTLRHELSHVLLYRSLGFRPPRWLDEGLAMRASAEWGAGDGFYTILALPMVARGKWRLDRVERDFAGGESSVRRSYALAKGFVRDLFKDDASVTDFILEARRDRSVDVAFLRRFGTTPDVAFAAWARNLPWWGEWVVTLTSPGVLWLAVTTLFLLAAAAAFLRRRRRLAMMDEEEPGPEEPDGGWIQ